MKKYYILFIIIIISIFTLITCTIPHHKKSKSTDDNKTSKNKKTAYTDPVLPGTWTIIIHFSIDNNIGWEMEHILGVVSNYLNTLENIERMDVNDKLKILVLMDGSNPYEKFKDGYYFLSGGDFDADLVVDKQEINSGSTADVKEFLEWAVTNYSSDNYFYCIFSHGNGFDDENIEGTRIIENGPQQGIAIDDAQGDSLTHNELDEVTSYLKELINKKIDIFYTYACLMGGVELAYEIKDNANFFLTSEESILPDLWSFEALEYLIQNNEVTASGLGKAFCDSAYDFFSNKNRKVTYSLIDLSKVEELYNSINNFAETVIEDISINSNEILYNNMAKNSFIISKGFYIDIGDYMDKLIECESIHSDIKSKAIYVKGKLNNCVIYKKNHHFDKASGLSIFYNIWKSRDKYSTEKYRQLLKFGLNKWNDFIILMDSLEQADIINDDNYEPDDVKSNSREMLDLGFYLDTDYHTIHNKYDVDWKYFTAKNGYRYTITCDVIDKDNNIIEQNQGDLYLTIFNENKSYNISSYNNKPIYIDSYNLSNNKFYIKISSPHQLICNYRIEKKETQLPNPDSYENDNTSSTAKRIRTRGIIQYRTIHVVYDKDIIFFKGYSGRNYKITFNGNSDILKAYLYDEQTLKYLESANHTDKPIGWGSLEAGGIGQPINFTCNKYSKYYIMVISKNFKEVGSYELKVNKIVTSTPYPDSPYSSSSTNTQILSEYYNVEEF